MIPKSKIKEIIDLIEGTDINEIEITSDKDTTRLRISRMTSNNGTVQPTSQTIQNILPPTPSAFTGDTAGVPEYTGKLLVTSPLVGTYYSSPKPGDPVFITEGDTIRAGQPVCIIEAMKIFNEIESEVSGRVIKILVDNEQPVEFGQTLMVVEPL